MLIGLSSFKSNFSQHVINCNNSQVIGVRIRSSDNDEIPLKCVGVIITSDDKIFTVTIILCGEVIQKYKYIATFFIYRLK